MSKVGTGDKKYIIIPEAYPLFAMAKVFGPKNGPLSKPTPTPIPIIGELLQQTGKYKVSIYEVVPTEIDKKTGQITRFSDPVQLGLGNYTLPYEEIKNGKTEAAPAKVVVENIAPKAEIKPEVVVEEPKAEEPAPVVEAPAAPAPVVEEPVVDQTPKTEAPAEPVAETAPVEEAKPEEPVERADAESEDTTSDVADPWPNMTNDEREAYSKMSKQERKAARRAHREAASQSAAE